MFELVNIVLMLGLCVAFGFPTNIAPTSPASLNDGGAPRWTNQKRTRGRPTSSRHVYAGDNAHFKCVADPGVSGAAIQVDWYKDATPIRKDSRADGYKLRYKSQILYLRWVTSSDAGNYTCVVSNDFGHINHTFQLRVTERVPARPLLMLGMPSNKTVHVGDDVMFRCAVFSEAHPSIQWVKHVTIRGVDHFVVLKESGIELAEAQTLTLRNVSHTDAGRYSCVARNLYGLSRSAVAHLAVLPPRSTAAKL